MSTGTKNLGLIKAIHVGANPPLNTKILWYNDSVSPYTTGPAKVHYYYDVAVADWMPLGFGATINGIFTYIAFASSCTGADFSMNFDGISHCFWAVVTSNSPIAPVDLVPELFVDRWTKFCKCGGSEGSGNYTYIAFADDCNGTNFGTELQYEVDCEACQYADTFLVESGNSSFHVTNTGTGVEIELVDVAPGQQVTMNVQMPGGILLTDLINYCIRVSTLGTYSGEMEISLGVPTDTITINSPVTDLHQLIQNQGSQLIITIPNNGQPLINSTIVIQIGTAECCADVIEGHCYLCHNYFGLITSSTPITELTPELFANKWIKICCNESSGCDCSAEFNLLEQQITNLNEILQDQINIYNAQIQNLTNEIANLQTQFVECCDAANLRISNLEILLNESITAFQELLDGLTGDVGKLDERVTILETESTPSEIMVKISGDVATISREVVQNFKDVTYDPNRTSDYEYIDTKIVEAKTYTDDNVNPLSVSVGTLDATVVDHETRITTLELP